MNVKKIENDPKKNNLYKIPIYVAISVFITCFSVIYFSDRENFTESVYIVCGLYGFVCLGFLFFQLYAFIKAHTDYNEDVERIKYAVFEAEKE